MSAPQTVLITGGNTGLGLEVVKALYKSPQAYNIIVGSRSLDKALDAVAAVKKELPFSSSTLSLVQVDVESDDSINNAFQTISSEHPLIDCLINNAGAGLGKQTQDGEYSLREGWNKSWDINVTGSHVMTTTFMPLLLKSATPRLMFVTSGTSALAETERLDGPFAHINASPEAGWPKPLVANPVMLYRSAKTGLNMMMREWTRILKHDGVRVFAISPGFLATGLGGIGADKLKKLGALDPSEGGNFIIDVVEGKRDQDVGKVIRADSIQPW